MVWAEFVTTSKKPGYGRHGGGALYMLKGPGENTACTCRLIEMLIKITIILFLWTLTITVFLPFICMYMYIYMHMYM